MKAIFFEEHGDIDRLKYGDLPTPEPKAGEALIRVRAVALNHLDIWVRRGWPGLKLQMPHIGGSDIAGELVSINAESAWSPGTRVMVNPGIVTGADEWTRAGEESLSPLYKIIGEHVPGGLAEYVCVPAQNLLKIPDEISFEDAAAPLLVACTTWRMLFKRAALRAGETVLVVGSGGGVNSLSIALAKAAGATVYALAGDHKKAERARTLGATEVILYKENSGWATDVLKLTKGRGIDVVIDNVGEKTITQSLRAATRGGRIITVGNTSGPIITIDNRLIFSKQLSLIGSTMGSAQDLVDALEFMWTHKIKPTIDCVEPLKNGIVMLQRLESGEHFGKIVLIP